MAVGLGWRVIACNRLRYLCLLNFCLTRNTNNKRNTNRSQRVAAPVATGLRTSGGRPQTTPAGAGAIRVRHREFIKNITSEHTFENGVLELGINAGDTEMFPWLSNIANGYERYCVNSMSISYEPFVSTTESGAVIMQVDYDPADEPPISKSHMLNSLGATRSAVWMRSAMALNRKELSYDDHLFVRHAVRAGFSENLKLYDVGTVFIALTDVPAPTTLSYGEVWVTYDITLMVPAFHKQEPNAAESKVNQSNYFDILGTISSDRPNTMLQGSSINFTTDSNNAGECAITFQEPFTGLLYLEQSGYAEDSITHLELEPTTTPADNWITKLARLGGGVIDYILLDNKWKYLIEVVADAGESIVFDALAVGAGDLTTWIGETAMALSPYAEALMLPLIGLRASDQNEIRRRIQSRGKHNLIPAGDVVDRSTWVQSLVSGTQVEEE
ncbi:hypothetical protein 3 [Beihai tombus-like virus 4]|uniref:hypothetical protein 3 n=1 Tax=Beihai tombus-like virus 4 TaxID=1922725 RepID=UPI00090C2B20|nr:hypothetical protein 3 [Beihai tombus-like virus 4]APG76195.1 hypothetical protein 3 [Beihai tombus-like virus 4]APG76215.1 hypothetical protein 2 [Beihai tombus-like virus 4]APG76652.1 hypothetical protein 3 [Beihai tombus-like virus 4]